MTKNTKTVRITISNENVLKLINKTPTLSRLSRIKLVVGENIEVVNHSQFAAQQRMFQTIGVKVTEIK